MEKNLVKSLKNSSIVKVSLAIFIFIVTMTISGAISKKFGINSMPYLLSTVNSFIGGLIEADLIISVIKNRRK